MTEISAVPAYNPLRSGKEHGVTSGSDVYAIVS